jgi:hypothetical protein
MFQLRVGVHPLSSIVASAVVLALPVLRIRGRLPKGSKAERKHYCYEHQL